MTDIVNVDALYNAVNLAVEAGVPVTFSTYQARYLIRSHDRSVLLERRMFEWASIINSLACAIIDGPTSNDVDAAQDAQKMVGPYLAGNQG